MDNQRSLKSRVRDLPKVRGKNQSVMKMEATIENPKMQELRNVLKIRSLEAASLRIPPGLGNEAVTVLRALFDCFEKQQHVKEGLLKDWIWGFQQSQHPPLRTLTGMKELSEFGYLDFKYKDNTKARITDENILDAFVTYEKKLLDIVYEPLD